MVDLVPKLLLEASEAKETGDYLRAENMLREVLTISPDNIVALSSLALIAIELAQYESAIPLLTKAIKRQPSNHALLYNLGLAYQGINEIEAAIYYYKTTIGIKPDFVHAYNNLGVAYQYIGKIELANLYLEKAFNIDPNCIEAFYNYAKTYHFTDADTGLINKIKECRQKKDISEDAAIKLEFTLAKIHDDLGQYEFAFKHYHSANSLKNRGFNSKSLTIYVNNIIKYFTRKTIDTLRSRTEPSNKRFIFIVGMPRSGTSLVEQIISSHPLVQSAGEIGFIGDVVDELPELLGSTLPYPECIDSLNSRQIEQIALRFNLYLSNMKGGFLNITDKSSINFLHIGLIKILFPQSVIIHVYRDPIATCLSCYFQNFDKQHQYSYDLENLGNFYKTYKKIIAHWESIFNDEVISINYEQLVQSPRETMSKLILQCGLEWDNACYEFYNENNAVNSASNWQVRQPIHSKSIDKWKNYQTFIGELLNSMK